MGAEETIRYDLSVNLNIDNVALHSPQLFSIPR